MFPPDQLVSFINYCPYSPASLTDHDYIELDIIEVHNSFQRQTEYWKLNTYFLEHSSYWSGIKSLLKRLQLIQTLLLQSGYFLSMGVENDQYSLVNRFLRQKSQEALWSINAIYVCPFPVTSRAALS